MNRDEERQTPNLEHGRGRLLLVLCALPHASHLVLALVQWDAAEARQEVVEDHVGAEHVLAEPHHAAARHCGQRGVLQVLHLEHDAHLRGQSGRGEVSRARGGGGCPRSGSTNKSSTTQDWSTAVL